MYGNGVPSLLAQPNTWCLQHGQSFEKGYFYVGAERDLTSGVYEDLALCYVIANAHINRNNKVTSHPDKYQNILWYMLYETSINNWRNGKWSYARSYMNNGYSKECSLVAEEWGIYDKAYKYKEMMTNKSSDVNNSIKIDEEVEYNENASNETIAVLYVSGLYTITGVLDTWCEGVKVSIDDNELDSDKYSLSYDSSKGKGKLTININDYAAEKLKIKVEAMTTQYKATFRILWDGIGCKTNYDLISEGNLQRAMVTTGGKDGQTAYASAEKEIEPYQKINVSLQKSIVRVGNGGEDVQYEHYMGRRKPWYSNNSTGEKGLKVINDDKEVAKTGFSYCDVGSTFMREGIDESDRKKYNKYTNPLLIEPEDSETKYNILLYNNDEIRKK